MSPATIHAIKHTLASVLICPWIQHQAAGLPTTANERSISLRCLRLRVIHARRRCCVTQSGPTLRPFWPPLCGVLTQLNHPSLIPSNFLGLRAFCNIGRTFCTYNRCQCFRSFSFRTFALVLTSLVLGTTLCLSLSQPVAECAAHCDLSAWNYWCKRYLTNSQTCDSFILKLYRKFLLFYIEPDIKAVSAIEIFVFKISSF